MKSLFILLFISQGTLHAAKFNVLFIMADDLRAELGCYGAKHIHSPNIDKLAARGTLFERAYCQVAVCNPSRSSLLGGVRPDTTGVLDNQHFLRPQLPDIVTLPQHFKNNGWHSLSLGKIFHHSEREPGDDPQSWSEPSWYHGVPDRSWFSKETNEKLKAIKKLPADKRPKLVRGPPFEAANEPDDVYSDAKTAAKAIETLQRLKASEKPFFLGVGFHKPHLPFTCPQKYWDMYPADTIKLPDNYQPSPDVPAPALHNWYELRTYGDVPPAGGIPDKMALNLIRGYRACTSFVDAQIGRVLDELDRLGLRESTIVVLLGDHGYHLGENGIFTKMTNFELGTHAPLIVSAPGQKPGQRTRALVEFVDIYPTLAELCSLKLPSQLDGTSFAPLLANPEQKWKRAAFSQYLRPGKEKFMGRSLRTDRWRYTEWTNMKDELVGTELYDERTDPQENQNLAKDSANAETVAALAKQLHEGPKKMTSAAEKSEMTMITRRQFIHSAGLLTSAVRLPAAAPSRTAPRILYSNDTTNITSCISPFHKEREPFSKEMLEATVDEVTGLVDAHMLQPGLGMVPMWPSKVLPLADHYAWIKQRYGQKPDPFGQFVLDGGDIVQVFIDRCHQRQQAAFISLRMNDAHHKEFSDPKPGDKPGSSIGMSVTKHYVEHPEYRLKPGSLRGADLIQNWAVPEVRAQKFALIRELCENYDLDGLELDFLRFYGYFRLEETPLEQRQAIMTGFVREVRQLLDQTIRNGNHRWLCARVPCHLPALDVLGLDLKSLVAVGLDMVNASEHYFTTQQHDLAAIRSQTQGATLYFELCHTIWKGDKVAKGYDVFPFRRATPEHLHTSAHFAYARGADGISLFNFAYYRQHGQGEGRGVFGEPPFEALKALRDPKALAQEPQHWFIAQGWRAPGMKPLPVPRKIEPAKPAKFNFDLAPPAGGWKQDARIRIQSDKPLGSSEWSATFNGEPLTSTNDVSEPFPVPYPSLLGKPDELRTWVLPAKLLRAGKNSLEVTLHTGEPVSVIFVDLATGQPS